MSASTIAFFSLIAGLVGFFAMRQVIARLPPLLDYEWSTEQERKEMTKPQGLLAAKGLPMAHLGQWALLAFGVAMAWWCLNHWGLGLSAALWFVFACSLVMLAAIDWDTTLLPDAITLPLMWAGILAAAMGLSGTSLVDSVWGCAAGYSSLWLVYFIFKVCTGNEALGFGDFKFFAAIGAWLGVTALIPVLLIAAFMGSILGLVMKSRASLREGQYIPFGPSLTAAALIFLVMGWWLLDAGAFTILEPLVVRVL